MAILKIDSLVYHENVSSIQRNLRFSFDSLPPISCVLILCVVFVPFCARSPYSLLILPVNFPVKFNPVCRAKGRSRSPSPSPAKKTSKSKGKTEKATKKPSRGRSPTKKSEKSKKRRASSRYFYLYSV